jgi:hypothetical protein
MALLFPSKTQQNTEIFVLLLVYRVFPDVPFSAAKEFESNGFHQTASLFFRHFYSTLGDKLVHPLLVRTGWSIKLLGAASEEH